MKDHITAATARRRGVAEPDISAGLHLASPESRVAGGLDERILVGADGGEDPRCQVEAGADRRVVTLRHQIDRPVLEMLFGPDARIAPQEIGQQGQDVGRTEGGAKADLQHARRLGGARGGLGDGGLQGVEVAADRLKESLVGDPRAEGGRRALFFSGDDGRAKAEVGALIERLGFFGIDLGPISVGGRLVQFPGGPLPALNLVKFG